MKKVNNFWWPDSDIACHAVILNQVADIDVVLPYVKNREICIQAGGNVGVWARRLLSEFQTIYTWEPDPENFYCLVNNVPEPNVIKFQACLGDNPQMVQVGSPARHEDNNCGAYQVIGKGMTPVMRIDDLVLPGCDLMYLDIEGYELYALRGAERTIAKYRPVISLEQKVLVNNYGLDPEAATEWLIEKYDYKIVERIHRDIVLIPR